MRRLLYPLLLILAVAVAASACTVNELPAYRAQIADVQLSTRVDHLGEVIFVSPALMDPNSPDAVARNVMEGEVRERLASRLSRLGHPDLVADRFSTTLGAEFDAALPWQRVAASQGPDALFSVTLDRYGVSVDAGGVGVLFFDVVVEGRFLESGVLIYEETVRSAVPLADAYEGYDTASEAAARAMNLMALDQLTEADFQAMVYAGAQQAAERLVAELLHDAWE